MLEKFPKERQGLNQPFQLWPAFWPKTPVKYNQLLHVLYPLRSSHRKQPFSLAPKKELPRNLLNYVSIGTLCNQKSDPLVPVWTLKNSHQKQSELDPNQLSPLLSFFSYHCKQEFFCLINSVTALFSHAGPSAEEDVVPTLDIVQSARIRRGEREI